jgi:hypothetical protein
MKFTEFLLLVSQMRDAQRAFYSNRTQSNLIDAKTKEKAVDAAIRSATAELSDIADSRQADLFADDAIRAVTQRRTEPYGPSVDDRLERGHG